MLTYHSGALSGSAAYRDTSGGGRLTTISLCTSTDTTTPPVSRHRTQERRELDVALYPETGCDCPAGPAVLGWGHQKRPRARSFCGSTSRQVVHQPERIVSM